MKKLSILILGLLIVFTACSKSGTPNNSSSTAMNAYGGSGCTTATITADGGKYHRAQFGSAFKTWLQNNGYSVYNKTFYSSTSPNDSVKSFSGWGGANESSCSKSKIPVIFIHGNGDSAQDWAFDGPGLAVGAPRDSFLAAGYTYNELFALSVNNPTTLSASSNYHKAAQIEKIKNFIQAVKAYTGQSKVNIIAHSMGVTMARRAIYDYSLTSSVNVFIGIAGANGGLSSCGTYPAPMVTTKTCGAYFFWGMPIYVDGLAIYSPHLLKMVGKKLATKLYSIYSTLDEIVQPYTSARYTAADANVLITTTSGHYGLMHSTGSVQVQLVNGTY